MKRITDLKEYKSTLPYASEIFGVYQPLLGWKSKRIETRVHKGYYKDLIISMHEIYSKYQDQCENMIPVFDPEIYSKNNKIEIAELPVSEKKFDSVILNEIAKKAGVGKRIPDDKWATIINDTALTKILNDTVKNEMSALIKSKQLPPTMLQINDLKEAEKLRMLKEKVNRESLMSRMMIDVVKNKQYNVLNSLFMEKDESMAELLKSYEYSDPFEFMDPKKDLDRVGLSPIGIVHLFRQFFYEFDTFLGTPVGHIWLSPGSTVELIEVSTRKTITEKALELQTENIVKTETSLTEQDEISDAVKEDNKNDIKFGANVNAKQNWVWGSASQSASFDMNNTQQIARENAHKHMRQQSEKLSTEIRQNYKSTFRTVTEYTDTTSKRYVLTNTTEKLINYELRRKMRQVGVQVQDIGTYLCWQTYIDEPGRDLGVASLVHVAKSPDFDQIPHPEEIVPKNPFKEKINIQIPFVGKNTDDNDQAYTNGAEYDWRNEYIECDFPQRQICNEVDYYLGNVILQTQGAEAKLSVRDFTINKNSNVGTFTVHLDYVHFHNQNTINVEATLYWMPNQDLNAIKAENEKKLSQYTAKLESAYKKEFVDAARERIKLASNILPRKYDELREEERIIVYRNLIQELLVPQLKIPQPDYRTRHVVSELINSIFDVDKMLYFVAPEWWKPRNHYHQSFGIMEPTGNILSDGTQEMKPVLKNTITNDNLVGWGGINEMREDNYYITEDSIPAKFGSSLGWLLQLDGDNMRNAFLNAPWVKAVIPIRPGKEKAALNWLKQIEGTNGITENDMYTGKEPELQGKSMLNVLDILADKVQKKHSKSQTTSKIPDPDDPANADNVVSATPVDKVFEHGFYPLQGGFKVKMGDDFEIFDQWIEVLPTDQVVAVEVEYDPKTGRQI